MTTDEVAITEDANHIVPLIHDDAAPLPRWANVVIIGGGIMGTSIAFHLAEAGVREIVVIERETLGSGSSAKPLGGYEQPSPTLATSSLVSAVLRSTSGSTRYSRPTSGCNRSGTYSCVAMSPN